MSDDADYEILLIALFSLWSFYPIVYFRGILKDSIPEAQVTYWLVLLPLVSKHLYGFIDLYLVD
jgi:bacteriorhodopsin